MKRSLAKRVGVPTVDVRWRMPTIVRDDMEVYARTLGLNGGELMTIAAIRLLRTLHEKHDQEFDTVRFPRPQSMNLERQGYSLVGILEGLREISR